MEYQTKAELKAQLLTAKRALWEAHIISRCDIVPTETQVAFSKNLVNIERRIQMAIKKIENL